MIPLYSVIKFKVNMIRNLLLIFLFPGTAAFAQTYEISVLGSTTDDSLHIQTFYSHSANRGLINVTDSRKNKPVKNFKMKTSAGKIDKEGIRARLSIPSPFPEVVVS